MSLPNSKVELIKENPLYNFFFNVMFTTSKSFNTSNYLEPKKKGKLRKKKVVQKSNSSVFLLSLCNSLYGEMNATLTEWISLLWI